MQVKLYTTTGCHLCEAALALLQRAQAVGLDIRICEVEIADSECLMNRYGLRIPVVARDHHSDELGWPFDYDELLHYLSTPE